MAKTTRAALLRPLKLYATGHLLVLGGAWAMSATGSMLPMALAASACCMLTVPLVRHFLRPGVSRR